jgi:hypothetical protein
MRMRVCVAAAFLPLVLGACTSGFEGSAGSARTFATAPRVGGSFTLPPLPVVGGTSLTVTGGLDGGSASIRIPGSTITLF